MPEIRRILVPVDFSKPSRAAFEYALFLADRLGATVDLLHVWEPPPISVPELMVVVPDGHESLTRFAEKQAAKDMDAFLASVPAGRVTVRGRVELGDPATLIQRVAVRDGYDLVVMGTVGRKGLAHVVIGSVAERVVRTAPCPVVTVRAPA